MTLGGLGFGMTISSGILARLLFDSAERSAEVRILELMSGKRDRPLAEQNSKLTRRAYIRSTHHLASALSLSDLTQAWILLKF